MVAPQDRRQNHFAYANAARAEHQIERRPREGRMDLPRLRGFGSRRIKSKWGLLLPGAPEPRLTLLRRQGFKSVFQTALRGLSNRSIVVVGNYEDGPITAEPCR